jgi:hypothetical protein
MKNVLLPLVAISLLTASNAAGEGEKLLLSAKRAEGDLTRVQAKLEVRGELKFHVEGKPKTAELAAVGIANYYERMLAWGATVTDECRSARHYDVAEAHLTIDGKALPLRDLADEKRLIGARVADAQATLFMPHDLLSRDELDLLALPGDSLAVDRLLPDEAIAVGDSWKLPAKAIQLLCNLDGVDSVDVEGTLKEADDKQAKFELAGKVEGAIDGISTELELTAKYTLDRAAGRVSWLALSIKEKRGIGHVGPGIEATSRLQLSIDSLRESQHLADERLAELKFDGSAEQAMLLHKSAGGKFTLAHDRRWHVINDDQRVTVLRMIDRGELAAQVNLTPLAKQQPGKTMSLEAFKADVEKVLGKNLAGVSKASERINQHGYRVCRVEAVGKVNDLDIVWIYYHVADREGQGIALAFTVESRLVSQVAGADETIVDSLLFAEPIEKTADNSESAEKSVLK